MTLKVVNIWGRCDRPWGHEVRVDFEDEEGKIYNSFITIAGVVKDGVMVEKPAVTEELIQEKIAELKTIQEEQLSLMSGDN